MVAASPSQSSELTLELAAQPESIGAVRDAVTALARNHGFTPPAISAVAVAVSEAATNVIVHAYHDQPVPGLLRVRAAMDEGDMAVVVSDDGPGVRPRIGSPGLGLGLPLIASLAHQFEVGVDRAGRSCVRMSFGREAGATSLRPRGRFRRPSDVANADGEPPRSN